jgi:hypothetical protein
MEEGTWGMTSGDNVAGLELACVWIAEGLMIVGGSIYMARGGLTSYICCPDCTVWFKDPTKTMSYEMPEDLDKVVHDLKGLNLKTLHHLTPLTGQKPASLEFDIFFCPACSTFGCFDLQTVELIQKKKKVETKKAKLIDRLLLPKEGLADLLK